MEPPDVLFVFDVELYKLYDWYKWKILVIYDLNTIYHSGLKPYDDIRYFKKPSQIEVDGEDIVLHSKNGKQLIRLKRLV